MKKNIRKLLFTFLALSMIFTSMPGTVNAAGKGKVKSGQANVDQRLYPDVGLDDTDAVFVHPPFFNARVKVKLDKKGRIIYVKDDQTGKKSLRPNDPLKKYWKMVHGGLWNGGKVMYIGEYKGGAKTVFPKFTGKKLAQVKKMKFAKRTLVAEDGTVKKQVDIVAYAIKEAVINAIEGKKGKGFLKAEETLTPEAEVTKEDTKVSFKNTLPKGFKAELVSVVHGAQNSSDKAAAVKGVSLSKDGKTLTIPKGLEAGHYYVNIKDASNKYRSPDFDREGGFPPHYPFFVVKNSGKLTLDGDALKVEDDNMANVLKNIKDIKIKEKGCKDVLKKFEAVSLHHGFKTQDIKKFLGTEGVMNKDMNIFEKDVEYEIIIDVWGMGVNTFNYKSDKITEAQSVKASIRKYLDTFKTNVLADPAVATANNKEALENFNKEVNKAKDFLKKSEAEITKEEMEAMKKFPSCVNAKGEKKKGSLIEFAKKVLVDFQVMGERTEKTNAPKNPKLYPSITGENSVIEIKTSAQGLKKEGNRRLYLNYVTGAQYEDSSVDVTTSATPKYGKAELPVENYDVQEIKNKKGKTTGYKITVKKIPEGTVLLKPVVKLEVATITYFENGDLVFVKKK